MRRARRNKATAAGIGTLLVSVLLFALLGPIDDPGQGRPAPLGQPKQRTGHDHGALREAITDRRSGMIVTLKAEVVRVLPDDNDGSRHQRFILELNDPAGGTGTVLVAHNIDLAPRVPCAVGDRLTVRGQYEWNEKGGVIHWTHRDPQDRREGGWIDHAGVRYQ